MNISVRQSTSPEMRPCSAGPIRNWNESLFVCEETFHENLIVPGPMTVALSAVLSSWPMAAVTYRDLVTSLGAPGP